jgi:hypothetical protein
MDWREFESFAREEMSKHLGVTLTSVRRDGHPKHFDMVSEDGSTVGDAKFLTLVHGKGMPPAKFMEIAGHVWLLERTPAIRRFLVFGNQRRVAEWWLEKYGQLPRSVEFYFLGANGELLLLSQGAARA